MERNILSLDGRPTPPDLYEVRLHPDNYGNLGIAQAQLEHELAAYLEGAADERSWHFSRDPIVRIRPSAQVRPGEVSVASRFEEVVQSAGVENVAGQTTAVRLEEIQASRRRGRPPHHHEPGAQQGPDLRAHASALSIGALPRQRRPD